MKQWQFYPVDQEGASRLGSALGLSPIVAQVLLNRGLSDQASAAKFINPRLADLTNPFEIPGTAAGVERVLLARERGEKVLVYGDYDVDGVTATTILIHTLRYLGLQPDFYIPHRYGEGYGLSLDSVRKIAGQGVNLIVTVDCGVSSVAEIAEAKALGVEVVVTDHHNVPAELPAASSIVNPKLFSGEHPAKYLAGAGVAFKFAWALLRQAGLRDSVFLTSLLDLAALGTISDVVPLLAENRVLAVTGLSQLSNRQRPGIKELAESASLGDEISIRQVNFGIAPRLNAAGRLEHAGKAVELLLTADFEEAKRLADELCLINSRRQDIGANLKEEVFEVLNQRGGNEDKIIFAVGENWHPGVIGIVASQIVDTLFSPTVLIGISGETGRGSARAPKGLNLYALLNTCRDLFLDFGGHEGAAGFEIAKDKIPELRERLLREAASRWSPEELRPILKIDSEIQPAEITLSLAAELEKLSPFGEGNPPPLWLTKGLRLDDFRTVGKQGKHLKAWFTKERQHLEVIGFGFGHLAEILDRSRRYDLVFHLDTYKYQGNESVQLTLVDLKEER